MSEPSRLGRRLKYFRLLRKMTQEGLHQASGVSRAVIANLEAGNRETVHLQTVERLARALHTDLNQLTGFDMVDDTESEVTDPPLCNRPRNHHTAVGSLTNEQT